MESLSEELARDIVIGDRDVVGSSVEDDVAYRGLYN
jgi:hypothetical protein